MNSCPKMGKSRQTTRYVDDQPNEKDTRMEAEAAIKLPVCMNTIELARKIALHTM